MTSALDSHDIPVLAMRESREIQLQYRRQVLCWYYNLDIVNGVFFHIIN